MVNNICAVSGCERESYPGCGLSFHSLPSELQLKTKWLEVIPGNLRESSVVCTLHFKPEDYRTEARKRLKPGVIPSIFSKMPLTPAEKMRRYREKLKKNPEKYEEYKKKDLKRLKPKVKKVSEMSESKKETKRKVWREQKRKQKEKKKQEVAQSQIKPTPHYKKRKIEEQENDEESTIKIKMDDNRQEIRKSFESDSSNYSHSSETLVFYDKDPLVPSSSEIYQNVSEYDAVGINVAKKLAKMTSNQAILAESIINNVLRRGLLNKLKNETDLCDVGCECDRVKYTLDNRILMRKT